mmetsp:Transcript_28157/g.41567  ORF Transcript_28157/g.41567 Transcript_28157/m.41567 type:complete len:120 (+) Transcript_28157:13-372(+)
MQQWNALKTLARANFCSVSKNVDLSFIKYLWNKMQSCSFLYSNTYENYVWLSFSISTKYTRVIQLSKTLSFSLSLTHTPLFCCLCLGAQHHTQNFKSFTRHKFHLNHHITPNRSFMFFS